MTKRELAIQVAKQTGYKQQDVMNVIQETLELIVKQLATGEGLELRNFGVFELVTRKSKVGRNPNAPSQQVVIPERVVVKFKPGKVMRTLVSKVDPKDIRAPEKDSD